MKPIFPHLFVRMSRIFYTVYLHGNCGNRAKSLKLLEAAKTIRVAFADYFGKFRTRKQQKISDSLALGVFLETRASHVAQTALYGYIRTRAGSRFPELFENDEFVTAINIAKWQLWISCLSDLSVYAGGLLTRQTEKENGAPTTAAIIKETAREILERTQIPEDAGEEFSQSCAAYLSRLDTVQWEEVGDNEAAFTVSPEALVYWAPIVDELKALDSEIVRNSVRFRWQEVRRDLRGMLDARAVFEARSSH